MATRTQSQSQSQDPAPVQAPVSLGAVAESEHISKAARLFVDVPGTPRVICADGSVSAIQREQRADGTLGEYLLSLNVRKSSDGTGESAQRFSLGGIQSASRAYAAQGFTLIEPGAEAPGQS